jgi:hypothetical protein
LIAHRVDAAAARNNPNAALAEIIVGRRVVEMLVGVDQILDFRAARLPQGFLDFIDAANVGVDEHRRAARAFDDREISGAFGSDDCVSRATQTVDCRFHGVGISD